MKKFLIVQPHSDDAILSCSNFILNNEYRSVVLTIEKNDKRIKEDDNLSQIIEVPYKNIGVEVLDDYYAEYFNKYGRGVKLTVEDVFSFYEEKLGIDKIREIHEAINRVVSDYKKMGYIIVYPLGIGHPFHLLVNLLLEDKKDVIFYKEFPHSYKKKAQKQLVETLKEYVFHSENSDKEYHDLKMAVAQKCYKSQSGFFFYEHGYILKGISEEFYKFKEDSKHIKFYVISKGRPNGKTFDFLKRGKVDYIAVVEPQDEEDYRKQGHKNILVLPENDRGFSYVVNFAKNQYDGINPLVIMDDDIMNFFYSIPGIPKISLSMKTEEELKEFFEVMNQEICNTDFDIGTIGKSAFDWNYTDVSPRIACEGSKFKYSGLPVVIIINSLELLKFDFDETLSLKSDIDYALKCMYLGIKYAKFIHFLQQTKMNKDAKQKGGLAETYKKMENIQRTHDILLKRWPNNIMIDEKKKKINGVDELKIIYKPSDELPYIINKLKHKDI